MKKLKTWSVENELKKEEWTREKGLRGRVFIPFYGVVALLDWVFLVGTNLFSYSYTLAYAGYLFQSFRTPAADLQCLAWNFHLTQVGARQKSWNLRISKAFQTKKKSNINNNNPWNALTERNIRRCMQVLRLSISNFGKCSRVIFLHPNLCTAHRDFAPAMRFSENM